MMSQPKERCVPIHERSPKEKCVPKVWSQPLFFSESGYARQPRDINDEN